VFSVVRSDRDLRTLSRINVLAKEMNGIAASRAAAASLRLKRLRKRPFVTGGDMVNPPSNAASMTRIDTVLIVILRRRQRLTFCVITSLYDTVRGKSAFVCSWRDASITCRLVAAEQQEIWKGCAPQEEKSTKCTILSGQGERMLGMGRIRHEAQAVWAVWV